MSIGCTIISKAKKTVYWIFFCTLQDPSGLLYLKNFHNMWILVFEANSAAYLSSVWKNSTKCRFLKHLKQTVQLKTKLYFFRILAHFLCIAVALKETNTLFWCTATGSRFSYNCILLEHPYCNILLCLWNCIEEFQGRIISVKNLHKDNKILSRKKNLIMIFGQRGPEAYLVQLSPISKLTKVSVYCIIRTNSIIFLQNVENSELNLMFSLTFESWFVYFFLNKCRK